MKSADKTYVKHLVKLAQLDVDAALAYDQAIQNIEEGEVEIIEALENFQDDHIRHIDELGEFIEAAGEEPPEFKRDAKGVIIEGMTKVMSKMGTRPALVAMIQNEMLTNSAYKAAVEVDMPMGAKAVVERNYADERRHLKFITAALKEKFGQAPENLTRPSPDTMEEAEFHA